MAETGSGYEFETQKFSAEAMKVVEQIRGVSQIIKAVEVTTLDAAETKKKIRILLNPEYLFSVDDTGVTVTTTPDQVEDGDLSQALLTHGYLMSLLRQLVEQTIWVAKWLLLKEPLIL